MRRNGYPWAGWLRRGLCLLLTVLLLPAVQGRAEEAGWLESAWLEQTVSSDLTWRFPFSDEMFAKSSEQYDHQLARASLGMALSAFRATLSSGMQQSAQGDNLISYLTQAGFHDFVSMDYDQIPSLQTVASVIGRKEMTDSQGEFTLIAVGVCGGQYQMEWLSNFTVGTGTRHEGFSRAAQNVEGRILVYLAERGLKGRVKLWISGFSRAGAVSNLVAADMSDFGSFGRENVFAYTFATPRSTRDADRADYPNIFNIMGKMDIVPQVPLGAWGFGRYGTDLTTPARETDWDYEARRQRADKVYRQLTGREFGSNPEVNHQLRTMLDFLLEICPDQQTYTEHVQEIVKDMWAHRDPFRLAADFARLAGDAELINDGNREEAYEMMNFTVSLAWDTLLHQGAITRSWNSDISMLINLAREHTPVVYIAWMFSSEDPAEVFSDAYAYQRFVVEGEGVVLTVEDLEGELQRLNSDGTVEQLDLKGGSPDMVDLFMFRSNQQSIAVLPVEGDYMLREENTGGNPVRVYGVSYNAGDLQDIRGFSLDIPAEAAKMYYLNIFGTDSDQLPPEAQEALKEEDEELAELVRQVYAEMIRETNHASITEHLGREASFMYRIERMNVFHLSWLAILNIVIAVPLLLLLLLLFLLIRLMIRRRRKRRALLMRNIL